MTFELGSVMIVTYQDLSLMKDRPMTFLSTDCANKLVTNW